MVPFTVYICRGTVVVVLKLWSWVGLLEHLVMIKQVITTQKIIPAKTIPTIEPMKQLVWEYASRSQNAGVVEYLPQSVRQPDTIN